MKATVFQKANGNYCLYAECMYNDKHRKVGEKTIKRYYKTIAEALNAVDNIIIPKSYCWRLIRITDNKNFTNRIYRGY